MKPVLGLRIFFSVVLITMLAVTGWAAHGVALWSVPRAVVGHPWFVATLCDAYWGFLTFYLWQFYKEPAWSARLLWLLADLLLGNMAMSAYGLAVCFSAHPDARVADLVRRSRPVSDLLPAGLVIVFGAVCLMTSLR